jgi:hypothetical protein
MSEEAMSRLLLPKLQVIPKREITKLIKEREN